ncbi:biopolymer transporter ExbD [Phaeobacter gallaeciensis]|jgi:biopolymer transport protein ExbD|uniref:biopolymer transporter ExbD n=1 Tax=Phaeobacter gallaeciensis TaxID=60890 RepID=UPI00237FECDC|nr:biopolymer transporter ExbD [Phaeobacter gallaeciensis]MDE4274405.1 biopolymer transporter ExbD [Phaeobacter gallaeciensis]MDE4299644.1 biopolymer transporter ExbD [Phaeobacter gallaeciensis]MDE5184809.1 biopolymer transporter ExbD [Phaeobacter gallaeciensis]
MDFSTPKKRETGEPILPMINVVFLLLIFFLLSSQIAPRAPFAVVPPKLESGDPSAPEAVLFMAADGRLHFAGAQDEGAIASVKAQAGQIAVLTLRADAEVPAHEVAALIARLRAAGIASVTLTGTGS